MDMVHHDMDSQCSGVYDVHELYSLHKVYSNLPSGPSRSAYARLFFVVSSAKMAFPFPEVSDISSALCKLDQNLEEEAWEDCIMLQLSQGCGETLTGHW